jgi:hypothetical protein
MAVILDLPPGTLQERRRAYELLIDGRESPDPAGPASAEDQAGAGHQGPIALHWHRAYDEAVRQAKREGRLLFIHFFGPRTSRRQRRFQAETLADPGVRERLKQYVCARLPLDAQTEAEGEPVTLLQHVAFREMLGSPGVAVVDYTDRKNSKTYGQVVSAFPITGRLWYTPKEMRVILDLPRGTLTQRTLIYAVRTHPEKPASADGPLDAKLVEEAESHSRYQAGIRRQGHHRWQTRFHRINAILPPGLTAREIVAESWPGENLVEAAIECVRSWRLSSGHWSAVRARHRVYAYDMKRGGNGVWYATGIFGRR